MDKSKLSAQQKAAYMPFGGGSRVCLGVHLAHMELRCAATFFFKECKGARLGPTANEDMQPANYFVITPKGHKCEITMKA